MGWQIFFVNAEEEVGGDFFAAVADDCLAGLQGVSLAAEGTENVIAQFYRRKVRKVLYGAFRDATGCFAKVIHGLSVTFPVGWLCRGDSGLSDECAVFFPDYSPDAVLVKTILVLDVGIQSFLRLENFVIFSGLFFQRNDWQIFQSKFTDNKPFGRGDDEGEVKTPPDDFFKESIVCVVQDFHHILGGKE